MKSYREMTATDWRIKKLKEGVAVYAEIIFGMALVFSPLVLLDMWQNGYFQF